jgi:prepilin-type N-terminal cleavage/methylation domain-containing protein
MKRRSRNDEARMTDDEARTSSFVIRHSSFCIRHRRSEQHHRGFSLLEIILALAILAGSLAALGEVMRLADQNSTLTRDESEAQILASTIMDELVAGARQLMAVSRTPLDYETELPWVYSIAVEQTGYNELVAVRVLVEQDLDARLQPARYELIRWFPNPDYIPPSSGGSGSSGSSSGGTGSTSAGGASSFGGAGGGGTR